VLDFFEFVLTDFGIPIKDADEVEACCCNSISWLIERYRDHRHLCAIVIDEAQDLPGTFSKRFVC
jgi:superfamily I DNA and RNA helicase